MPCCSTSSTQPKCMGSTRRLCRIVSRRDVTSQVEFGIDLVTLVRGYIAACLSVCQPTQFSVAGHALAVITYRTATRRRTGDADRSAATTMPPLYGHVLNFMAVARGTASDAAAGRSGSFCWPEIVPTRRLQIGPLYLKLGLPLTSSFLLEYSLIPEVL